MALFIGWRLFTLTWFICQVYESMELLFYWKSLSKDGKHWKHINRNSVVDGCLHFGMSSKSPRMNISAEARRSYHFGINRLWFLVSIWEIPRCVKGSVMWCPRIMEQVFARSKGNPCEWKKQT